MSDGLTYDEFRRRYLEMAAEGNPDLVVNEEDVQKAYIGILVYSDYVHKEMKKSMYDERPIRTVKERGLGKK